MHLYLGLCVNQAADSCTATPLKRVKVRGKCKGASSLKLTPSGNSPQCSNEPAAVVVKLKKKGKKAGQCKVTAMTVSASKPKTVEKSSLNLVCNPSGTGEACASTTTKCTPSGSVTCEPLVTTDTQGIPGTYQMVGTPGQKLCQTNTTQNRFGPCSTDADCGGGAGNCAITPFATADGFVLPFPTGIKTVFTVAAADPPPPAARCDHAACVACGNEGALCAGIPRLRQYARAARPRLHPEPVLRPAGLRHPGVHGPPAGGPLLASGPVPVRVRCGEHLEAAGGRQ